MTQLDNTYKSPHRVVTWHQFTTLLSENNGKLGLLIDYISHLLFTKEL